MLKRMISFPTIVLRIKSVTPCLFLCAMLLLTSCFAFKRYTRHPDAAKNTAALMSASNDDILDSQSKVIALGAGAMPELFDQMENAQQRPGKPGPVRVRIVDTAATIGKPAPLLSQILALGLSDKDAAVRQTAAFRAGEFPSLADEIAPYLRKLLRDPVPEVRAATVSSLGSFRPPNSLSNLELIRSTQDADIIVSAGAAAIAVKRPEPEMQDAAQQALTLLLASLDDPSPASRAAVVFAFGKYGRSAEPVVKPLSIFMLREKVPEVKLQAAMALVRIGTPIAKRAAIPVLKTFAKSKNQSFKLTAAQALKMAEEEK